MKKIFIILFLAVLGFAMFSACNKSDTGGRLPPPNNTNTVQKFTVTFVTNGGTPLSPIEVETEGSIDAVNKLITEREGYIFDGWYETVDFSDESFFGHNNIYKDTVLYAKWRLPSAIEILEAAVKKTKADAAAYSDVSQGFNNKEFLRSVSGILENGVFKDGYAVDNGEKRYVNEGSFYFDDIVTPFENTNQTAFFLYHGVCFAETGFYQIFQPLALFKGLSAFMTVEKTENNEKITVEHTGGYYGVIYPDFDGFGDVNLDYTILGNKFEFTLSEGRITSVKQYFTDEYVKKDSSRFGETADNTREIKFFYEEKTPEAPLKVNYSLKYLVTVIDVFDYTGWVTPYAIDPVKTFEKTVTPEYLTDKINRPRYGYSYRFYNDEGLTGETVFTDGSFTLSGHKTFYCGYEEIDTVSAYAYRLLQRGIKGITEVSSLYTNGNLSGRDVNINYFIADEDGEYLVGRYYANFTKPHWDIGATEAWFFLNYSNGVPQKDFYFYDEINGNYRDINNTDGSWTWHTAAGFFDTEGESFYGKEFVFLDGCYSSTYTETTDFNQNINTLRLFVENGKIVKIELDYDYSDADGQILAQYVFEYYNEIRDDLFPPLPEDVDSWTDIK